MYQWIRQVSIIKNHKKMTNSFHTCVAFPTHEMAIMLDGKKSFPVVSGVWPENRARRVIRVVFSGQNIMSTPVQIVANQQNAQLSTGPKTEEGKAASSKNNLRHGFTGAFMILPWEKQEEFDNLLSELRAEHQPATMTETLLVEKMAQSFWLSQRAVKLQQIACFHDEADSPRAGKTARPLPALPDHPRPELPQVLE
jgi:hypothetical protein